MVLNEEWRAAAAPATPMPHPHTMPGRSGDGGGKNIPDDAVHRGGTAVRVTPLSRPARHTSSKRYGGFPMRLARTMRSPRPGLLEGDVPADGAAIEVGADLKTALPHFRLQAPDACGSDLAAKTSTLHVRKRSLSHTRARAEHCGAHTCGYGLYKIKNTSIDQPHPT